MQLTGSAFTPERQQINTIQRAHPCLTREADPAAKGRDEQEKEKDRPAGARGPCARNSSSQGRWLRDDIGSRRSCELFIFLTRPREGEAGPATAGGGLEDTG